MRGRPMLAQTHLWNRLTTSTVMLLMKPGPLVPPLLGHETRERPVTKRDLALLKLLGVGSLARGIMDYDVLRAVVAAQGDASRFCRPRAATCSIPAPLAMASGE